MTPVTKQKWIDALRSGEFNQCTGALGKLDSETHTMSYCCMGVLATIAGVGHRLRVIGSVEGIKLFDFDDKVSASGIIPKAFRSTLVSDLDLAQPIANLVKGGTDGADDLTHILSNMNDLGATFNEIADYLETVQ